MQLQMLAVGPDMLAIQAEQRLAIKSRCHQQQQGTIAQPGEITGTAPGNSGQLSRLAGGCRLARARKRGGGVVKIPAHTNRHETPTACAG